MEAYFLMRTEEWLALADNIFKHDNFLLVFTGQGRENVRYMLEKMENILPNLGTPAIFVNLGTAGARNMDLIMGNVYSVRSVKLQKSPDVFYGMDNSARFDCLTVDRAVSAENLEMVSDERFDFVDMELWEIARSAKKQGVPFLSFKYVSDYLSRPLDKNAIRHLSKDASKKLWNSYLNYRLDNDLV